MAADGTAGKVTVVKVLCVDFEALRAETGVGRPAMEIVVEEFARAVKELMIEGGEKEGIKGPQMVVQLRKAVQSLAESVFFNDPASCDDPALYIATEMADFDPTVTTTNTEPAKMSQLEYNHMVAEELTKEMRAKKDDGTLKVSEEGGDVVRDGKSDNTRAHHHATRTRAFPV